MTSIRIYYFKLFYITIYDQKYKRDHDKAIQMKSTFNNYQEIREAVRALCAQFPDEYHRKIDEDKTYPEEFA